MVFSLIDENYFRNIIMCDTEEYAVKYPIINRKNVFSASTLAYDPMEQIKWKLNPQSRSVPNNVMFVGKCVHEYFQRYLRQEGYQTEYEIRHLIPFEWGIEDLNDIIILGHVDAFKYDINTGTLQVIEIKTSFSKWQHKGNGEITTYHKLQAGFYAYALKLKLRALIVPQVNVLIVKLTQDSIKSINLSDIEIEIAGKEIERRAKEVAEVLRDKWKNG